MRFRWPGLVASLLPFACSVDRNKDLYRESTATAALNTKQLQALHVQGNRVSGALPAPTGGPRLAGLDQDLALLDGENQFVARFEPGTTALLVGVGAAGEHVRVPVPADADSHVVRFNPQAKLVARNDLVSVTVAAADDRGEVGAAARLGFHTRATESRRVSVLPSDGESVLALAHAKSKDGTYLVVGGMRTDGGGTVALWELATGRVVHRFDDHTAPVRTVAYEPARGIIASGGQDHTVRLRDAKDGALIATLGEHLGEVTATAWTRDGTVLLTAGRDGLIVGRDPADGHAVQRIETGAQINAGVVGAGAFAVATGALFESGAVLVVDLATAETRLEHALPGAATAVAFTPDGGRLAVGYGRGQIRVLTATGELVAELLPDCTPGTAECGEIARSLGVDGVPAPRDTLTALAFAQNGNLLSAALTGTFAVWSVPDGVMTRGFELGSAVLSGRLAEDSGSLALGLHDGTALVIALN